MDSGKTSLADVEKGHEGTSLPPASASYPHPSASDPRAQPIHYPHPSAPPGDNEWSGYAQQQAPQHQPHPPQAASFPQPAPPHAPQQTPHREPTDAELEQGRGNEVSTPNRAPIKVEEKSLLEAYILCLPLGFLGLHHFYLGRIGIGFLYFFTFGVFGIGWIIDWFRLPWLVKKTNEKRRADAERGYILYGGPYDELYERSTCSAYLFWLPPVGIFGGHHYYLGRVGYGIIYSLTLGLFGVGWLFDFFRIWALTKRANEDIRTMRSGRPIPTNPGDRMYLDDVYFLAFPLGFLGLHHFYMRRWMFGVIYFLTLGCMGVGFLADLVRMPYLFFRTRNEIKNNDEKFHVDDAYLMWFPLGITGMHHFYLHRWGWGFVYFFTFGLFGVGWLIDICRIPHLVKRANEKRERPESLLGNQYRPGESPSCQCEGAVHPDHGTGQSYQSLQTPAPKNMLVYAFPLDQHGHPMWSERRVWTHGPGGGTDPNLSEPTNWQPGVNGPGPVEPPPPYSPTKQSR